MRARSAAAVTGILCAAETLGMAGFASFPALLETLAREWRLSGSESGIIAGAYFAGYMLAVPLLSGLTDRIDTRYVYFGSSLLAASGSLGFSLLAQDATTAAVFQAVAGAGLAGTYMPGLKALSERVTGPRQGRCVSFYTSTFGIGTSLSLATAAVVASLAPWQAVFASAALGPVCAAALVLTGLAPVSPIAPPASMRTGKFGWRSSLRDPMIASYVGAYAAHCWELFGLRSWMVAFLAFTASRHPDSVAVFVPAAAAALVNLLGIPASILGNELAMRRDRRNFVAAAMTASGLLAWLTGFAPILTAAGTLALLAVYYVAVMSDSAALTAGLVAIVPPQRRGGVLALYSAAGFGAGFVGPLAFGLVLDAAGGSMSALAWGCAMGSLGLGCSISAHVMRRQSGASNCGENH